MPSAPTSLTNPGRPPRAVLTSLAGTAAGTAFLAAGWDVQMAVSRCAFAGQRAPDMRSPVSLDISIDRRVGTSMTKHVESFTFASAFDMVTFLASEPGQEFLTTIAKLASGVTATIVPCPAADRQAVRKRTRLPDSASTKIAAD